MTDSVQTSRPFDRRQPWMRFQRQFSRLAVLAELFPGVVEMGLVYGKRIDPSFQAVVSGGLVMVSVKR